MVQISGVYLVFINKCIMLIFEIFPWLKWPLFNWWQGFGEGTSHVNLRKSPKEATFTLSSDSNPLYNSLPRDSRSGIHKDPLNPLSNGDVIDSSGLVNGEVDHLEEDQLQQGPQADTKLGATLAARTSISEADRTENTLDCAHEGTPDSKERSNVNEGTEEKQAEEVGLKRVTKVGSPRKSGVPNGNKDILDSLQSSTSIPNNSAEHPQSSKTANSMNGIKKTTAATKKNPPKKGKCWSRCLYAILILLLLYLALSALLCFFFDLHIFTQTTIGGPHENTRKGKLEGRMEASKSEGLLFLIENGPFVAMGEFLMMPIKVISIYLNWFQFHFFLQPVAIPLFWHWSHLNWLLVAINLYLHTE